MCRHLAYLGPPATLRSLLIDPPHSLYRQAWAPRLQRHGTVNADGFGIGWYAGGDPVPARYRRGTPIWGDPSLPDLARVISSGAVLAAVRSATPGSASGAEAAAPFGHGRWLFSHNGVAAGWRDWAEHALVLARASLATDHPHPGGPGGGAEPPALSVLSSLEALVDSAFLWALVRERLSAGATMEAALAQATGVVEAAGGTGRLNFLLTDGHSIAATACGDTLWYRQASGAEAVPAETPRTGTRAGTRPTADTARRPADPVAPPASATGGLTPAGTRVAGACVVVASEPSDDEPGWTEVPDRHLLTATARGVAVRPLAAGDRPARQRRPDDVARHGAA